MQRLIRILMATAAIVLLLLTIGFLLPSAWQVERAVVIRAPASAVFPHLNNLRQWRSWTVWYQRDPDLQTEYTGPQSGVGATSRWRDEDRRMAMKIMQSERNRLVAYTLLFNSGESSVEGTLTLSPEGEATRVVWRAAGEAGRNPANRYFALVLAYRIGTDFEDSLARLKQLLEARP